jgi:hypothetical protein
MFDRLIAFQDNGICLYFFVPSNLSLEQFIENVKLEIILKKRYNTEIKQIKRQLDKEQEMIENRNDPEVTIEQAKTLIQTFVSNHPLDNRTPSEILKGAGAVELINKIPPSNILKLDELD